MFIALREYLKVFAAELEGREQALNRQVEETRLLRVGVVRLLNDSRKLREEGDEDDA